MHKHCCHSKYKPVTHVLFDLDGTILDSEKVCVAALQKIIEGHGAIFYKELILSVQGCPARAVAQRIIEYFNFDMTIEQFLIEFNNNKENIDSIELMPGVERTIKHLHKNGVPIAIATSSTQQSFERKTSKFQEIIDCFHHIVCGGTDPEVTKGKPEPDIFLIAASRFDDRPKPSKCLVFEDSISGMQAGLAAGMQVIILPDPQVPYDSWKLATLRLDSFNYFVPEMFGLPPFEQCEMADEFGGTKVSLYEIGNILDKDSTEFKEESVEMEDEIK